MSSWKKTIEAWFSAMAFAEAGEREIAIEMVNLAPDPLGQWDGLIQSLRNSFAAVAFAEADCPEMAVEIMDSGKRSRGFLENVGLHGVRVRYGLVPVTYGSFLETVGLKNARTTYFSVPI